MHFQGFSTRYIGGYMRKWLNIGEYRRNSQNSLNIGDIGNIGGVGGL